MERQKKAQFAEPSIHDVGERIALDSFRWVENSAKPGGFWAGHIRVDDCEVSLFSETHDLGVMAEKACVEFLEGRGFEVTKAPYMIASEEG